MLCRLQQGETEDKHESGHSKLPKRGEQWQQSADVAEFVQKGHVHFMDSVRPLFRPHMLHLRLISWPCNKQFPSAVSRERDSLACSTSISEHNTALQGSEEDAPMAQEARAILQQTAQKPPAATNGTVSSHIPRQRPEQALVRERTQPAPRVQRTPHVDYDALPKPQPYPLEGDVIAYRLLHIGADWTPQVIHKFHGSALRTMLSSVCSLRAHCKLVWELTSRLWPETVRDCASDMPTPKLALLFQPHPRHAVGCRERRARRRCW